MQSLGGRKFVGTQIVNILLTYLITTVPELREQAMMALVANNGLYVAGNAIGKFASPPHIHTDLDRPTAPGYEEDLDEEIVEEE